MGAAEEFAEASLVFKVFYHPVAGNEIVAQLQFQFWQCIVFHFKRCQSTGDMLAGVELAELPVSVYQSGDGAAFEQLQI